MYITLINNLIYIISILFSLFCDNIHAVNGMIQFEANLHHLALSAKWMKHVDSAVTICSASHIVIASSRGSIKHRIARKRGRNNDGESNPTSNPAVGPSICWWRGGRVSRQLFNWKVLPRSLVSKAARQGLHFSSVFLKFSG